jgi:hypothetical protein
MHGKKAIKSIQERLISLKNNILENIANRPLVVE